MKTTYPIALHTSYAKGITRVTVHVFCIVWWFNICMKFYENMSRGFKLMERTQKFSTHKGQ